MAGVVLGSLRHGVQSRLVRGGSGALAGARQFAKQLQKRQGPRASAILPVSRGVHSQFRYC